MHTTWKPHEMHGDLTERSDLPDSVFAFPKQRKEPMTDASHVRNAIARFDQTIGVSDSDRALAFANIKKAARHYGVDMTETDWHQLGKHPSTGRTEADRKKSAQKAAAVPATAEVCGPPAKIMRWIDPFASMDAANLIFDSDLGLSKKLLLGGATSGQYVSWQAGVIALMKVFADSTNPKPGEPYDIVIAIGQLEVTPTGNQGRFGVLLEAGVTLSIVDGTLTLAIADEPMIDIWTVVAPPEGAFFNEPLLRSLLLDLVWKQLKDAIAKSLSFKLPLPSTGGLGGLAPGVMDTGTLISPGEARRLAARHGVIPMVLGTRSEVLDVGEKARFHTRAMRIALRVQHRTCTADGCTIPAAWCHAHHQKPWAKFKQTNLEDATLLCGPHHRMVHNPAYRTTYDPGGTTHLTRIRR